MRSTPRGAPWNNFLIQNMLFFQTFSHLGCWFLKSLLITLGCFSESIFWFKTCWFFQICSHLGCWLLKSFFDQILLLFWINFLIQNMLFFKHFAFGVLLFWMNFLTSRMLYILFVKIFSRLNAYQIRAKRLLWASNFLLFLNVKVEVTFSSKGSTRIILCIGPDTNKTCECNNCFTGRPNGCYQSFE